jgi:hypothetical protein
VRRTGRISAEISEAYATRTDFCEVFAENMNDLYLLSFLLTADVATAEECFVSGLEDCVKGTYVFRDWARSWARRTIIQNAIRMLAPRKSQSPIADAPSDHVISSFGRMRKTGFAIGSILALRDFERFVFVMSVLEKYPDHDCSILLGCARQDIAETRIQALSHLTESSGEHPLIKAAFDSKDHEETAAPETHTAPQC